ncbi:MAG: chemotaxis protein CheA [Pseudomonadota bacterium]
MDNDNEILQDFLVEAGEILERLGEQLVDLEVRPNDTELLNAVFRGFHTVKGGASFLGLTPLVEICHRAEDVFNVLRQGARRVDAQLMDVVLHVLDSLNAMFDAVRGGEEPPAADPALLVQLEDLSKPVDAAASAVPPSAVQSAAASTTTHLPSEDMSDAEFASLLDALDETKAAGGAKNTAPPAAAPVSGDITDAEFEALLDELHGKGTHAGVPQQEPVKQESAPSAAPLSSDTEHITDAEFEALLDQLHGPVSKKPDLAAPPAAGASAPAAARPAAAAPAPKNEAHETAVETTVRVDTKRIDDIMNMVGELVLVRNRLVTLETTLADEEMAKAVANLDVVTANLQIAVMKTRMQPIKKVFGRFPRVVRDLARSLNKEVTLELQGEDTDLDKNLVEALADPLVHLVRNAVDHGIEMPEARVAKGKPRNGTVLLAAEQEGDHILLTIADDGAGMDAEVLRRKVVEKGLMDADAAARLDQRECYNLIFLPGFSTKTEISDVSGRGVGMDVVKTRIAQLNGVVEIDSQVGKGTRILIKVPLTLAIIPTLMVMLGAQIFALPLVSVNEIFNLDLSHTNVVDGQLTVMVRNKALPLFYLQQWLVRGARHQPCNGCGHVVVVNIGIQRVGFVVDQLLGQEEVVIKPLGTLLHGTQGLAGATITGDGRMALILDVPGLMKSYAGHHA